METTINHETSFEFLDSDHLMHENRVLRKVIREKDQRIADLEHQLELKSKYQDMIKPSHRTHIPPYGS